MSSAMIAATLWIPENKEPDWSAAQEALAKFTCPPDGFPEGHDLKGSWLEETLLADFEDDEATTDQERKKIVDGTLAGALRVVREAVEGERNDTTWVKNAGWVVYITGGLSSGDTPTDTAEAIYMIGGTGILEAAGFFMKPDKVMAVVFESEHATTVDLVADEVAAEKVVADYGRLRRNPRTAHRPDPRPRLEHRERDRARAVPGRGCHPRPAPYQRLQQRVRPAGSTPQEVGRDLTNNGRGTDSRTKPASRRGNKPCQKASQK